MKWTRIEAGSYTNNDGIVIEKDLWLGIWCVTINGSFDASARTLKEAKAKAEELATIQKEEVQEEPERKESEMTTLKNIQNPDRTVYLSVTEENGTFYIHLFGSAVENETTRCSTAKELADEYTELVERYNLCVDDTFDSSRFQQVLKEADAQKEEETCFRVYVSGEAVGTFFSRTEATAYTGDWFEFGYTADDIEIRKEAFKKPEPKVQEEPEKSQVERMKETFKELNLKDQLTEDLKSKWYYQERKWGLRINKKSVVFDDDFQFKVKLVEFHCDPKDCEGLGFDEIPEDEAYISVDFFIDNEYDRNLMMCADKYYLDDVEDILENILVYIANYI